MCHQLTAYKVTTVIKWIIVSTWTRQESTTKGTYSRLDMLNFTPAERERENVLKTGTHTKAPWRLSGETQVFLMDLMHSGTSLLD